MASVNTNAAAITALRTLQNTSKSLDETQNRISTGYRIGEAKDNAAYWSIATTLRSDNKALGTVKDALSLGSATVDVAYQSLNKAKDVLDQMKAKLVAATQDGVDKSKIQSEVSELQKQLKAIASSANFSGENWLDVDSTASGYQATKKLVSSYSRDVSGAITIGTVDIDTSSMVLVNRASGKEGILDGGVDGMTAAMTGGLNAVTQTTAASTSGSSVSTLTAPTAGADASAASSYSVVYKADGQTYTLTVDKATYASYTGYADIDGTGVSANEHSIFLNAVLNANADFLSRASTSLTGAALTVTAKSKGATSKVEIVSAGFTTSGTYAGIGTQTTSANNAGLSAKTTMTTAFGAGNALTLDDNDSLTFDVNIGTAAAQRVTVNKALISSVLNSSDGKIANVSDFKAVLTEALKVANLSNVTVSDTGGQIVLTGGAAAISITNVTTSQGTDLTSFNMANADAATLTALIAQVNTASERITSAAATLGSAASRIELQTSFVNTLMDTIDKGVGNLVDADMSEESTKLQALQVKQQLGVQSLSIANQSAQNILSLFRTNG